MTLHHELLRAFLESTAENLGVRRTRPFSEWKRLGLPAAVGIALMGCGGESLDATPSECDGDGCTAQCSDGIDNDGDGATDCTDADCSNEPACDAGTGGVGTGGVGTGGVGTGGVAMGGYPTGGYPTGGYGTLYGVPTEYLCDDGFDNDGDGKIDCLDEDCLPSGYCATPAYGIPIEYECSDGVDNDGDGKTDCVDEDCYDSSMCGYPEYGVPMEDCDNAVDDDYDGDIDCADDDCAAICGGADYAAPMPEHCNNNIDDDQDGTTDCADTDCSDNPYCLVLYGIPM